MPPPLKGPYPAWHSRVRYPSCSTAAWLSATARGNVRGHKQRVLFLGYESTCEELFFVVTLEDHKERLKYGDGLLLFGSGLSMDHSRVAL